MHTSPDVLYQSAVDDEFRAMLTADPGAFGLDAVTCLLPKPVESLDQGLADFALAGIDVYACNNTCSWGLTRLCDKFTN